MNRVHRNSYFENLPACMILSEFMLAMSFSFFRPITQCNYAIHGAIAEVLHKFMFC